MTERLCYITNRKRPKNTQKNGLVSSSKIARSCNFVGKYDKNGKPIYEGDIVRSDKKFYSTNLAEVRWLKDRCAFYFVAETVGTDIINRDPFESAYKINSLKVEVIGNIYQNPELLK